MKSKLVLKKRLETKKEALAAAEEAYLELLSGGVKSYGIGSRNLTRFDIPVLEETIEKLEKEIDEL